MVAITAATNVIVRITGQGVPGPSGSTAVHAATHSAGAADPISVENLATAGAVGSVPTSDGAGVMTMEVPAGGGDVTAPGGETSGNLTEFTGSKAIAETSLATADVLAHITSEADPHSTIELHVAAPDPHVQYQLRTEKNAASGYAGLDGSTKLAGSQQTYGSATNTAAEGDDSRIPIQTENNALVGTDGTPDTGNPFVTNSDSRNTDARTPTSHTHTESEITDLDHTDATAIHDNVASEISAVAEKVSPVSGDFLLIEDSAAANVKKRVQVGNLPTGSDADAIHDNVAAEISVITLKASPAGADHILLEDSAAANAKKRTTAAAVAASGPPASHTHTESEITDLDHTDTTAVHDNVASEISAVTLKASPAGGDHVLIEDSAAANVKKRTTSAAIAASGPPAAHTHTESEITDLDHTDSTAIHDNVAGEISAIGAKATPVAADKLIAEDSAAGDAKVSIRIDAIPHQIIGGAGTNDHAAIDAHIANMLNPHGITGREALITGILTGGEMTINGGDAATFDVAAGIGVVMDWSVPSAPVRTIVSFGPFTAEALPDISMVFTFVFVNAAGALVKQSGVPPSATQKKTLIRLQQIQHEDGLVISQINEDKGLAYNVTPTIIDYIDKIGVINSGNRVVAASTDLTVDKQAGTSTLPFLNADSPNDSATLVNIEVAPLPLVPISYRNGVGGFVLDFGPGPPFSAIQPDVFDNDSGTPATVQNNKWTIQRAFFFATSNNVTFVLGQAEYNSLAEAEAALFTEGTAVSPILDTATLVTFIIVKKGVTDLTDATGAKFVNTQGLTAGGGGSVPGTWLGLLDTTTASYTGLAGFSPQVDAGEGALELVENPTAHNVSTAAHLNHSKIDGSIDYTGEVVVVTPTASGSAANMGYVDSGDAPAIHDNVTGEINAIADKASPVGADVLVIEDSAAGFAKKKVSITNLPGGADADAIHDNVDGEINAIADKASPVGADLVVIEDSAAGFAKKKVSITNLPGGADADAIHDNVAAEISAITLKATPVTGDHVLLEDSAAANVKKRTTVGGLVASVPPATHTILSHDTATTGAELTQLGDGSDADLLHVHALADTHIADTANPHGTDVENLGSGTLAELNAAITDATLDDASDPRTDADAIHDNVAAEISVVTLKASPAGADHVLIEDSAAANVKKRTTSAAIAASGPPAAHTHTESEITDLDHTDATAVHDDVAAEISAITLKAAPAGADHVLIEDSAAANVKKRTTSAAIAASGPPAAHTHTESEITDLDHTDATAIHDNVASEISAITVKASPAGADHILLEDSAAANVKKRTTAAAIAASGPPASHTHVEVDITDLDHTDVDAIHDNVTGEINAIADKASPVGADLVMIEDSAAGFAKKKVSITNLPGGADADAIHDNVASEISAITEKTVPIAADLLVMEDSAATNAKKRVQLVNLFKTVLANTLDLGDNEIDNVKGAKINGVFDHGNQAAAVPFNFDTNGHAQEVTLTGNAVMTMSGTGVRTGLVLRIKQDATGTRVPTFSTNVHLTNSGVAPSWSPDNTTVDILSGWTDGTTYYLFFGGLLKQRV